MLFNFDLRRYNGGHSGPCGDFFAAAKSDLLKENGGFGGKMNDSPCDELTDATCDEKTGEISASTTGYPFAFVLRMRVLQIVCGISTLVMGAVAMIDEKSEFNLGIGIPAGLSTVLAASNSIYYSKGFDGYQPPPSASSSSEKNEKWSSKMRFLGTTVKAVSFNVILWGLATLLILSLIFNCVKTVSIGQSSSTLTIVAGIEFFLSFLVILATMTILWVDLHKDPDGQDTSDIVHSNTGTGVSMVTLSQSLNT